MKSRTTSASSTKTRQGQPSKKTILRKNGDTAQPHSLDKKNQYPQTMGFHGTDEEKNLNVEE